jgi:2-dehydropantoate 2-reductase
MSRVEFAILGAGAIGSILGAHLVRAGHSVVMLVRERRAKQLRRDGLVITGLVDILTPVEVCTDASQLHHADVLIVAMKTPGTAAALEMLRTVDIDVAFSIQNGVAKDAQLAQAFGPEHVLGALADTSGELLPSGEVRFTRNVNILLGELAGGDSARVRRISGVIDASGVRAYAVPDILSREWSKFVGWAGLMILSVTTRATTWKYLTDRDSALVLARLVREMGALARASGVELSDQAVLPVAKILQGSEGDGVELICGVGREFFSTAPEHRMSSLQDLEAGRPLEIEETIGDAVRRAQELKLSLPLLEAFYHVVACIDRSRDHVV